MNIGIAGAGAIGCHYGSLLQQTNQIVTYLARGEHLQAIQAHGLLHVSGDKQTRIQVHADNNPQLLANADIVLLTAKMTDFKALLMALKPHVRSDALLVTLQNGVAAPDATQLAFPEHALAAGTAFIGARIEKPGMVVHSAAGGIRLGWWQHGPGDGFFEPLMQALKNADVPVREEPDARLMLWRKLLWNIGFNALTAITRRFARDMAAEAETLPLVRQSMQEAVAVAQASGIKLTETDIGKHIEVTLAMGPVKTSMWQDIDRHRPTEVDFINAFIVERGSKLGINTPVNHMLTRLIHAIEHAE